MLAPGGLRSLLIALRQAAVSTVPCRLQLSAAPRADARPHDIPRLTSAASLMQPLDRLHSL